MTNPVQLDLFERPRGCPVCEGRTGQPMWVFESMCKMHFDLAPRPTDEDIRDAMEKGRKAAEAYRLASRSAIDRALSDHTRYR